MKKWLDKYESKGEVINPNNPIKLKEVVIKANRPTIKLQNLISASNTRENVLAKRRNYYFPYETEQTKNIRNLADEKVFQSSGDLISAVHPVGAVINALQQGADQSLFAEGFRFLPNKVPFKNAKTYNSLIPFLKPASKAIDLIQMFDKLHTADSLYNSADSIDLYNQFKNGGLVSKNSLNRKVTCSNCGWSWKLSDGGEDPLTCHKCGGTIKMKNGGELDEYKEKGEVKQSFRDQLLERRGPIIDKTAAPILLPSNLRYDKTRVVNGPSAGLTKTQLKNVYQHLKKEAELEKIQKLADYKAAKLFHENNPVAKLLGTRKAKPTLVKPTQRELAYGFGAGINNFFDVPGIGIANDFVNPLSIVSKGIISPWYKAPLQAQLSDSYFPYLGAAVSTALTVPMVRPATMATKTFLNPKNIYTGALKTNAFLNRSIKNKKIIPETNIVEIPKNKEEAKSFTDMLSDMFFKPEEKRSFGSMITDEIETGNFVKNYNKNFKKKYKEYSDFKKEYTDFYNEQVNVFGRTPEEVDPEGIMKDLNNPNYLNEILGFNIHPNARRNIARGLTGDYRGAYYNNQLDNGGRQLLPERGEGIFKLSADDFGKYEQAKPWEVFDKNYFIRQNKYGGQLDKYQKKGEVKSTFNPYENINRIGTSDGTRVFRLNPEQVENAKKAAAIRNEKIVKEYLQNQQSFIGPDNRTKAERDKSIAARKAYDKLVEKQKVMSQQPIYQFLQNTTPGGYNPNAAYNPVIGNTAGVLGYTAAGALLSPVVRPAFNFMGEAMNAPIQGIPGFTGNNIVNSYFATHGLKSIMDGSVAKPWKEARKTGNPWDYVNAVNENLMTALELYPLVGPGYRGALKAGNYLSKNKVLKNASKTMPEIAPIINPTVTPWTIQEFPGLHIKSTLTGSPLEKQLSKTGDININSIKSFIEKTDVGQQDKFILNKILNEKFIGQSKINYNDFRKAVSEELVPLERNILVDNNTHWGVGRIGYPGLKKSSYESAIKYGKEEIKNLENILKYPEKIEPTIFRTRDQIIEDFQIQLNDLKNKYAKNIAEYENLPLENNSITYSNSSKFGRGSADHFDESTLGHARTLVSKEEPDVMHILEQQSDYWQKLGKQKQFDLERYKEVLAKHETNYNNNLEVLKKIKETKKDFAGNPMDDFQIQQFEDIVNKKGIELNLRKGDIANPIQKEFLGKNHQERLLQENVMYAVKQGKSTMRYPTSETAAKIQGYTPFSREQLIKNLNEKLELVKNPEAYKLKNNITEENPSVFFNNEIKEYNLNPIEYIKKQQNELNNLQLLLEKKGNYYYQPSHETILKKYDETPKMIKKILGKDAKLITDGKGNTWYEFDIPKKFKEGKGEIKAFKNGGIIEDDMGQWAHPGQVTRINSNKITMQGVPYPVLGVDNTGYTQMMQPEMDYTFPGQYVTEYPMMQQGGLVKYQKGKEVKFNPYQNVNRIGTSDNTRVYRINPEKLENAKKHFEEIKKAKQKAKQYAVNQATKAKKFHTKWMQSPRYNEMLKNSAGVNAKNINNARWNNLKNIKVFYNPNQSKGGPGVGGASFSESGDIHIYPLGANDKVNNLGVHEFSHSIDRDQNNFSNRLIPVNDVNKMKKYANTEYYNELLFEDLMFRKFNIINPKRKNTLKTPQQLYYERRPKPFLYKAEPTETRARLNDIRQAGWETGIYDPFTQKVNKKIFDKLNKSKFDLETDDGWSPLHQLQGVYNDDQIIDLLNTVSYNNKVSLNPQMIDNNSDWEIIG